LKGQGIDGAQVVEAVILLTSGGVLFAVQDDAVAAQVKRQTDKLNAHLCINSRGTTDIGYLASPVTGGGIPVARFPQLFLLARSQGKSQPADWAAFAWSVLVAQGQKILKEGKPLETAEENLAVLTVEATSFAEKKLPVLKALGIA